MPRRNSEVLPLEEIKYVFNVAALQPGDILLMNTYHEVQRGAMARATGECIYDHAALYLGDAFLIEANGLGVVMNHIYSYGFKKESDACVMRKIEVSRFTLENIVFNAKSFMGMAFGTEEARRVPRERDGNATDESNRTFCSRLVSQCYRMEGICLFNNPDFCTPDDFLKCDQLFKLESSLVPLTEEMSGTVMNAQRQRDDFDEATYWASPFSDFSSLYGEDIQTMAQLIATASKHTELDEEGLEIIAKHGLFQPMKERKKLWPWFYNDDSFFAHFATVDKQLFFLCNQFLHFDLTFLPSFKQNFASACMAEYLCSHSKVIARIKQGFKDILDEAISARKRLADLYVKAFERDKDGFMEFVDKYGFYREYEYVQTPINIDRLLRDVLRSRI